MPAVGGQRDRGSRDDAGHGRPAGARVVPDLGVGPRDAAGGGRLDPAAQGRGDAVAAHALGVARAAARGDAGARPGDGAGQDDVVPLHGAALHDAGDQLGQLGAGVELGAAGPGEPALRVEGAAGGLGDRRAGLGVDEPVGDLPEQHPADQAHHEQGQQQRADHHAGLDGPAPEREREGGPAVRRTGAGAHARPTTFRPCSRRRAPSARSRGSPGRAPPWSGAAARAR